MSIIIIAPKSKVINMLNRWAQPLKQKTDTIRRVVIAIQSILPAFRAFANGTRPYAFTPFDRECYKK